MRLLFQLVKRIIISALLIYSFDVISVSLGFFIPINYITIVLVYLFDFSALACLFVFSLTF